MRTLQAALAASILFLFPGNPAMSQPIAFELDGALKSSTGSEARLGPGASLVPSAEGQGAEPGPQGPALVVPAAPLAPEAGTLCFRFRLSRDVRFQAGQPLSVVLARSPLFTLALTETAKHPVLALQMASREGYAPKGNLLLGFFQGGQWYHLSLAWDAAQGRLETYINGVSQGEMRLADSGKTWLPAAAAGDLELGGASGEGARALSVAVDAVRFYPAFLSEAQLAESELKGRRIEPLRGEGLTRYQGSLDLSPFKLTPIYDADFSKPLNVVAEDSLFEGGKRVRQPQGAEWVLEGQGRAWTEEGRLRVVSGNPKKDHLVLWNTRVFPESFLLEFVLTPRNTGNGLNIVFFSARGDDGGSVFDLAQPRRDGVFKEYHSGRLNCYHISYWACSGAQGGTPRGNANLRKNAGFFLPACGVDLIAGHGPGPHTVRILKDGPRIRLETNGRLALVFDDDGKTYGPVWKDGLIGLRQMAHTEDCSYSSFKVWKLEPAKP